MGVEFDLVYKDNRRIPLYGACFGCLNLGYYPDGYLRRHSNLPHYFSNMNRSEMDGQMNDIWNSGFRNIKFLQWHIKDVNTSWNGVANYCEAMQELIRSIPWMTGVSIHPLLKVVRVDMNQPADKVMMTLFLLRNLCHYEHYIYTYRNLLETHNFKPYAAAILSSLFVRDGGTPFARPSWKYNTVGEYNWLSPFTFGTRSLQRMLTEGENFNPWFQENFLVAGKYLRDGNFREERLLFNSTNEGDHEYMSRYRRLIDCMSVIDDEPLFREILLFDSHHYNRRRYYWHMRGSLSDPAPIIEQFVEKCLSFGYNPINA